MAFSQVHLLVQIPPNQVSHGRCASAASAAAPLLARHPTTQVVTSQAKALLNFQSLLLLVRRQKRNHKSVLSGGGPCDVPMQVKRLSTMTEDFEERQLLVDQMGTTVVNIEGTTRSESQEELARIRYEKLLEEAQTADLDEIAELGCIYQAGVDKLGRPVIVFIGKWFRYNDIDLDKAVLYLIKVLEPISARDYVVVYCHSRTSRDNIPSYYWIKEVYAMLPYRYKKNMKAFYIVHPTLWTKVTCWWFTTFMAPAIKHKIHNAHAIQDLSPTIESRNFEIPMFVTEHDMSINGLRFYQP